jgi:hypothetical protein
MDSELCGSTASLFSRALPQPRTHKSTRRTRRLEATLRRITGQTSPKSETTTEATIRARQAECKRGARALAERTNTEILRCAYRAVRAWRSDGASAEIERELRAEAEVAVSRPSSLFLLLILLPPASKHQAREQVGCRAGVCRPAGNRLETATGLLVACRWGGRRGSSQGKIEARNDRARQMPCSFAECRLAAFARAHSRF